jgi:hypothetical protein
VWAIEVSAAKKHTTVDHWLQHELIDYAGTVAAQMDRVIPGFDVRTSFLGQGAA